MNDILTEISKIAIVPVVVLEDAADAKDLAQALIKGGIPCAEVTFRTKAAAESIKIMSENFPEMLVGAGTVLSVEQAKQAVDCGAKFIVSPGLNPKVVKYCVENNIPVVPGCATPSDIEAAMDLGLEVVKFFPAEAAGGLAMIKAMSAPYTKVKFMPTGGINAKNINDYLSFKKVIACGGSWMVAKDLVSAKKFDEIEKLCKEAVSNMLGFNLKHVGINSADEAEAAQTADSFENMFGFKKQDFGGAYFNDSLIEVMKKPFYGKQGHIAIATNSVERAVYRFRKAGVPFNEESAGYNPDGSLRVIYFKNEIGGFAVHLVQK